MTKTAIADPKIKISVILEDLTRHAFAQTLAESLSVPIQSEAEITETQWAVVIRSDCVVLKYYDESAIREWFLDFVKGHLGYRRQQGGGMKQAIARACGLQKKKSCRILDANAGLGRDGFILASLGAEVLMLERQPIVAALLEDALLRLKKTASGAHLNLTLQKCDAQSFLSRDDASSFDVIYLDPMYPEQNKSALPKKEMRLLRTLVGGDMDASNLLKLALMRAKWRVVVKRARAAPALLDIPCSFQTVGQSTRFDVYQIS